MKKKTDEKKVKELNMLVARDDATDFEDTKGNLHSLFFYPKTCDRDLDCYDWENADPAELRRMTNFTISDLAFAS